MSATPPIVVLADLTPPGTSIDLEPCDHVLVEKNGLSRALRILRPALELDLDDSERISTSALRHASFLVGSAEALEPHRLISATPLGSRLHTLWLGLVGLRNVLASVPSVRRSMANELTDPQRHLELRATIGGRRCDPIQWVTHPRSAWAVELLAQIERARTVEGSPLASQLQGLTEKYGGQFAHADSPRLAVRALIVATLHPAWSVGPPSTAGEEGPSASGVTLIRTVERTLALLEAQLSTVLSEILDAPPTRALEPLGRDLERLSRRTPFVLQGCPRAVLEQPNDELLEHIEELRPRLIVTPHRLDPRTDHEVLAIWAAFARRIGGVFAADAPLELAGPIAEDDVAPHTPWRRLLDAYRGAFVLFPQRFLTRGSYGHNGEPSRLPLSLPLPSTPEARPWGSTAMFVAPTLAAHRSPACPSLEPVRIASGDDAGCYDAVGPEAGDEVQLLARVSPAAPTGQEEERWALGLCDLHAEVGPGDPGPLVPRPLPIVTLTIPLAARGRLPDGTLAHGPFGSPPPKGRVSDLRDRQDFWRAGADHCMRCGEPTIERRVVEGCRMSGDAWGTVEFECGCGWSTWLAFDDAFPIDGAYYFETKDWSRSDG